MASLVIEKAKGIDRRSSDIDIEPSYATQLKNFSLTKRPQAWSKTGAYADAATSLFGEALPANITWLNIAEMGLTQPSNTDIYVLHGKDASNNHHLWVSHYWDGSAFQSEIVKLTESEGPLTTDASSNANQIIDAGLSSSVDDYYNGWIVTITIGGVETAAIVTDYDGASKTLSFTTGALNGNSDGNTYYISRWPIKTGEIDAVDDKVRFLNRENALIGMTGNGSSFPNQYQLWYGYIGRQVGNEGSSEEDVSNFFLDIQQPLTPSNDAIGADNPGIVNLTKQSNSATIDQEIWSFYYAFEYDGYQIGPLSDQVFIDLTGGASDESIRFYLYIPYNACWDSTNSKFRSCFEGNLVEDLLPGNYSKHLLSRRITAVYVFMRVSTETTEGFWKKFTIAGSTNVMDSSDDEVLDLDTDGLLKINNANRYIEITSTPTLGSSYIEMVGQTNVQPNFKYGVALDSHFIAAGIRIKDDDKKDNYLISSIIDGDGVATPDNFGASNIINLGFFGSKRITGIKVIGDTATTVSPKRRLAVFTDDNYYILTLTTGASFDFALDKVGEREGCVAPDSLVAAEGLIFGISRNGFRVYTETGTRIIGEGLKTDFDSLTDPSECVGEYYKKERYVLFAFPTDQKYYAVNLLSENLDMFELSFAHVMTILLGTRAGELYSMSTSAIYLHGSGNTQAGTAITPQWKSKRLTAKDFFDEKTGFRGTVEGDFLPNEGFIRYRSDSAITLNAYRNGGTAITFPNLSLPAQATMQSKRFKFPLGLHCDDIDLEVTLSASQASSNTYLEFDLIKIVSDIKRRID